MWGGGGDAAAPAASHQAHSPPPCLPAAPGPTHQHQHIVGHLAIVLLVQPACARPEAVVAAHHLDGLTITVHEHAAAVIAVLGPAHAPRRGGGAGWRARHSSGDKRWANQGLAVMRVDRSAGRRHSAQLGWGPRLAGSGASGTSTVRQLQLARTLAWQASAGLPPCTWSAAVCEGRGQQGSGG